MQQGTRVRYRLFALVWTLMLALVMQPVLSVAAEEQVDSLPAVNNFASARFDILATLEVDGQQLVLYGKGSTVLPDRVSIWMGTDGSPELIYVVQIGSTMYVNAGSGWEQSNSMPVGNLQSLPISEQFASLQGRASSILKVGAEQVRGAATTHYQLWLSGANALDLSGVTGMLDDESRDLISRTTFKYDFWIGDQDGLLYQQNTVVMLPEYTVSDITVPASSFTTLMTYYNFNDPSISIQPPI
jgi:hypothetical protein